MMEKFVFIIGFGNQWVRTLNGIIRCWNNQIGKATFLPSSHAH
jgi:hypothetical protein